MSIKSKTTAWLERTLSTSTMDYSRVIAIFLPLMVDQAFIFGMSLMNTAMISTVSTDAISAVSTLDQLNMFIMNIFIAIATGGTVVISQYVGADNKEMVSRTAASALSAVSFVSAIVFVLMISMRKLINGFMFDPTETEVLKNAEIYLIGNAISFPLFALFEAITGVLRGIANTKVSMALSVLMNAIYLFLNFIFIPVAGLGVLGMVLSLFIARFVAVVCGMIYLLKTDSLKLRFRDIFRLDISNQKKILYVGIPFAAEQMFFNGGKLLTQVFISTEMGSLAVQTNAIGTSIAYLFQIIGNALLLTIIPVVGQCMGKQAVGDARKYVKSFLWLSSASFVLSALIILPAYPLMIKMFKPPAEIIDDIFLLELLSGIVQPFLWSISFIIPSAFRAAGDSRFTSVTSMLTMWLFRVAFGYILGITFGMGITGVWIAMLAEWGVRGIIFLVRFRGDKWYAHKLIENNT